MSKSALKSLVSEMVESYLEEASNLTNGEAMKIGKLAKKEAEKIRKGGGPLADQDADYMDMFASDAFSRNLRRISRTMNGGETDNREDVYAVVSKVIGKERANELSKGK